MNHQATLTWQVKKKHRIIDFKENQQTYVF